MSGWPEPAHDRRHPPFPTGNQVARRHGAFSDGELRPVAEALATELIETAPWTAAPAFAATVERWAWAEAACRAYRTWFDDRGLFDDHQPRAGQERWARFEATAARCAETLGLSPQSMASLLGRLTTTAAAVGDDDAIEQLRAEGRRIIESRRELTTGPEQDR